MKKYCGFVKFCKVRLSFSIKNFGVPTFACIKSSVFQKIVRKLQRICRYRNEFDWFVVFSLTRRKYLFHSESFLGLPLRSKYCFLNIWYVKRVRLTLRVIRTVERKGIFSRSSMMIIANVNELKFFGACFRLSK